MEEDVFMPEEVLKNLARNGGSFKELKVLDQEDLGRLESGVHHYRLILQRQTDYKLFGIEYYYGDIRSDSGVELIFFIDGERHPQCGFYKLRRYKAREETIIKYDEIY